MKQLPIRLEHEPLVDALFEVRANPKSPLADVLPGFLLHDLGGNLSTTRLPAADLPLPVRKQDPNLQFAPIQQIEWGDYFLSFGDKNLMISCKLPYPKWPNFKKAILDIMDRVAKLGLEGNVDRYSLKYVNLVQAGNYADQIGKVSMNVRLGDLDVADQHVSLQMHEKSDDIVHIYSVVTGAQARTNDGKQYSGILVDIDSIRNVTVLSLQALSEMLEPGLEALRQENKSRFFNCLNDATITELGPIYE